jgi:LAO/AO transport system kinase
LSLAQTRLRTHPDLDRFAESVADGRDDPYTAAERLLSKESVTQQQTD